MWGVRTIYSATSNPHARVIHSKNDAMFEVLLLKRERSINAYKSFSVNLVRFGTQSNQPVGIGWALWPVLAALPWLLPTHAEPWTTFYIELLMAGVLVPVACWAIFAARGDWRADKLVVVVALVACIPLLQALGGLFTFPGEAILIALYVTGFALTVWVARRAEEVAPLRLVEALLASLVVAALASTGMALYQWLGLDSLGWMIANSLGGRPIANIGQPNNLSTLLVWGLIAIWWGYSRQSLGRGIATLAAAYLLVGIALTQSRTGMVAVLMLASAALLGRQRFRAYPRVSVVIALLAWFALLVFGLEPASQLLQLGVPRTLDDQVAAGARPMAWAMMLEAVSQRPWLGYGWNQSVQAHVGLSGQYPDLHQTFQFAHNVVLDLMLWNGVPLGLLLAGGMAMWFWLQLRGSLTLERSLLLLALGVFLLHAMLELPHALAFFLLPVAVMMGTLSAWRPAGVVFTAPRIAVGLAVLIHAGAVVLIFDEYRKIESDLTAYRMREARIGNLVEKPAPEVFMLSGLQAGLIDLRIKPQRGMGATELERLRLTVVRYPSAGGLLRYSRACALNGRLGEARWALAVLCRLNSKDVCQNAALHWKAIAADGNPEMGLVTLPADMVAEMGSPISRP